MSEFPPRLHVLLARKAPTAVVFRRGPSRQVATVAWDRKRDTFSLGQWMKGRIYAYRADLSPDGRHLIYFAENFARMQGETGGTWTAVSRAPYLKALGLWGKGDCWHGGGLFVNDKTVWINQGCGHSELRLPRGVKATSQPPFQGCYGGECTGVYFPRLLRDGWSLESRSDGLTVFDKPISGHWLLRKRFAATIDPPEGRGVYSESHQLVNRRSDRIDEQPDWEWAEVEGSRIVWASRGCLWAGRVEAEGLGGPTLLHDFSTLRFEERTAPY